MSVKLAPHSCAILFAMLTLPPITHAESSKPEKVHQAHQAPKPAVASTESTKAATTIPSIIPATNSGKTASSPLKPPNPAVVSASNLFGFDLLKHLLKKGCSQNIVISPTGLNLALAMAAGGASGSTKNAMLNTLRLSNVPTGEIRNSHNSLLQQLLKGADADVTINIADSIWTDNRTLVQPTFISQNQKLYDAEIRSADFSKASTVNSINDWVSNKTRGRIRTIIDHLEPASKLVILNAVYFKGGWYSPFEQKETKQKEFTLLSGNKKKLPMMEDTRYTYYMKGKDFQALRLPYGSGARFDMWLFLPDEKPGSFRAPWQRSIEKMYEDFLNDITQSDWSSITGAFASERVHIVLPRFKVEMAKTVGDNLKSMGMNIAFDKEKANFSEMISLGPHDQAWIEEVLHKTFIEVNEKGTEAAAATGVIMGVNTCGTIKEPPPPKEFIADHPFVLGIRDSSTGAILFLGSIADPG